jgi:hypothetical protein
MVLPCSYADRAKRIVNHAIVNEVRRRLIKNTWSCCTCLVETDWSLQMLTNTPRIPAPV